MYADLYFHHFSTLYSFLLDFVLVYEEIEGEETPKSVLRFRKKYMSNLQKSQLEFEEVWLTLISQFVLN